MDSICNQDLCLLATVAPSKPAAIPGQVIIWRYCSVIYKLSFWNKFVNRLFSLNDDGPPKRLQRIAFTEPIDVKFTRLPDGRITLMILQSSGVDNVSLYIWRGLLQFQPETTVRVPGAQDLQLVSSNGQLILALTVASSVPEVPYGPVRMFRAHFLGQFNWAQSPITPLPFLVKRFSSYFDSKVILWPIPSPTNAKISLISGTNPLSLLILKLSIPSLWLFLLPFFCWLWTTS